MGWHLIQNKENYMKKKDLILAGAVLLLAGILALALRLPKTENGNKENVTGQTTLCHAMFEEGDTLLAVIQKSFLL